MMFDKDKFKGNYKGKKKQVDLKLADNRLTSLLADSSTLSIASYASKNESKFGIKEKMKLQKDKRLESKVKYQIKEWKKRDKSTANDTYKLELQEGIGSKKEKNILGIGKMKADQDNDSAWNLGLRDETNPRMLARQIASWKVARNLNIRVLSNEKYGLTNDGNIMGISAMLPTTAISLADLMSSKKTLMDSANLSNDERQNYLGNKVFSGKIQKELSDLQLIDAITGQTDRRGGNIFIDLINQSIHGIDNDQAFEARPKFFNEGNAVGSFKVHTKQVGNDILFDDSLGIEYIQSQIDINTAEKVLAINDNDLENILYDKVGKKYTEYLTPLEISMAKMRLNAIKNQINKLKKQNKLITKWDEKTYNDAMNLELAPIIESKKVDLKLNTQKYQSYLAREVNEYAHGNDAYGRNMSKIYRK